jgi:hypothetical protein
MTHSPYTVTSALTVACPVEECRAYVGEACIRKDGTVRFLVHSARRRAADAQRTQEVNPEVIKL